MGREKKNGSMRDGPEPDLVALWEAGEVRWQNYWRCCKGGTRTARESKPTLLGTAVQVTGRLEASRLAPFVEKHGWGNREGIAWQVLQELTPEKTGSGGQVKKDKCRSK